MNKILRILIVEDNPADTDLIREMLACSGPVTFQVESVARLSEALARLANHDMDAVLLDLGLPDGQGLPTLHRLQAEKPEIPIIVLSGADDHDMAVQAVRDGAQDFLIKGKVRADMLLLSVQYAIERKRMDVALRKQAHELEICNEELIRFNSAFTGRELRMIELKQQVDELAAELGRPLPYALDFLDAQAQEAIRTRLHPLSSE
ncbi:MAG: response regulator [Verrucomicrobiota bacterium]